MSGTWGSSLERRKQGKKFGNMFAMKAARAQKVFKENNLIR